MISAQENNTNDLRIMVVDDEPFILEDLNAMICSLGYECLTADNGQEAIQIINREKPDLVLTDQNMAEFDGFAILHAVRMMEREIPVVLFSCDCSVEKAVHAIKMGAHDYVKKNKLIPNLDFIIKTAIETAKLKSADHIGGNGSQKVKVRDGMVFRSSLMKQIIVNISKLSASNASVLVYGESGTGKELVARSVHHYSNRCSKPFIPLDCGALPGSLLESELFGFEKGAFTGADRVKSGIIELACGGTLFLDEITELDLHLQSKLLRVLQERQFRRVGGKDLIHVNVRIVSATNRDPEEAVATGKLREDLYYRLNVVPIYIPPLRDRTEDIPVLVHHFIDKYSPSSVQPVRGITAEAMNCLESYKWPGNVRELENVMQRILSLIEHDYIQIEDIPENMRSYSSVLMGKADPVQPYKEIKKESIKQVGRKYLIEMLKANKGNVTQAAKQSGLSRTTLYRMMKKYRIDRDRLPV